MPILPAARTPVRCSALCGVLVNHSLFGVCPHATQLTVTSIIAPSMRERDRQTDRQTDRQSEKKTERDRQRETVRVRQRDRGSPTYSFWCFTNFQPRLAERHKDTPSCTDTMYNNSHAYTASSQNARSMFCPVGVS